MRTIACLLLVLLLNAMMVPVLAASEERYSYITVKEVNITVENERAEIVIDYSIDEGIRLLVMLLGTGDLKTKVLKIVNYEDARIQDITLESATLVLDKASVDYGDGVYWFPEHEFGVIVPTLSVKTPQTVRRFNMTKGIPDGIGHFRT